MDRKLTLTGPARVGDPCTVTVHGENVPGEIVRITPGGSVLVEYRNPKSAKLAPGRVTVNYFDAR